MIRWGPEETAPPDLIACESVVVTRSEQVDLVKLAL